MEMPIPVNTGNDQSAALGILRAYVLEMHGIKDADPITLLAGIAWDTQQKMADRIRCALGILSYCHTPFKAIDFVSPDSGPAFVLNILGNVVIGPSDGLDPEKQATVIGINDASTVDTQ